MLDLLNEISKLSFFYKLKNMSGIIKTIGVIYLIVYIVFSMLIITKDNGELISTKDILILLFVLTLTFIGVFLLSVYNDNYFNNYPKIKNLSKEEYNFVIENKLDVYKNFNYMLNVLVKLFKNIDFLTSETTKKYINFIENKSIENQTKSEKWILSLYNSSIKELEKIK